MLRRVKVALVRSFVGAITVGWVFAQSLLYLAYTLSAPVTSWLARREYGQLPGHLNVATNLYLEDALPELIRSGSLMLLGYLLLRWLYFKPVDEQIADALGEKVG